MPHIASSSYRASGVFCNAHVNTLWAALKRKVDEVCYQRTRLDTPDGDFLDLDWSLSAQEPASDCLLIALHGLEGSSNRPYIKGFVRFFNLKGWDALAVNFRGCGGQPNDLPRTYHVGETGDLHAVLEHVISLGRYQTIVLAGFSLGGNVILKYLGEQSDKLFKEVRAATVFSVPCHVPTANIEIERWYNRLYLWKFLWTLNQKMREKSKKWPGLVAPPFPPPFNFHQFDNRYTAPLNGFENALDYWQRNSSLPFLEHIKRPVLLVNAWDDSFLSPACYPTDWAAQQANFYLETPLHGGHVGFVTFDPNGFYWTERRAWDFICHTSS